MTPIPRMTRKKTLPTKATALLLSVAFLFPEVSWAFDQRNLQQTPKSGLGSIGLPKHLGFVTDRAFRSDAQTSVVYIQDLHASYTAQTNIRKIIERLQKTHGFKLIAIEGSYGDLPTERIAALPFPNIKERLVRAFMRSGQITGSEAACFLNPGPHHLFGAENAAEYDRSLDLVRSFLPGKVQQQFQNVRFLLEELSAEVMSGALAEMDHQRERFLDKKLSLPAYWSFLRTQAAKQRIDLNRFPEFLALSEAAPAEVYPADQDTRRLREKIRAGLYTDPAQSAADQWQLRLEVMERILNIAAYPEDIAWAKAEAGRFSVDGFLAFYRQTAPRFGLPANEASEAEGLDRHLAAAMDFYRLAEARNHSLVANALRRMRELKEDRVILVAGGYHAAGIQQELRALPVNALTVRPAIGREHDGGAYYRRISGEPGPFRALINPPQHNYLAPMSMLMNRPSQQDDWTELALTYLAEVASNLGARDTAEVRDIFRNSLQILATPVTLGAIPKGLGSAVLPMTIPVDDQQVQITLLIGQEWAGRQPAYERRIGDLTLRVYSGHPDEALLVRLRRSPAVMAKRWTAAPLRVLTEGWSALGQAARTSLRNLTWQRVQEQWLAPLIGIGLGAAIVWAAAPVMGVTAATVTGIVVVLIIAWAVPSLDRFLNTVQVQARQRYEQRVRYEEATGTFDVFDLLRSGVQAVTGRREDWDRMLASGRLNPAAQALAAAVAPILQDTRVASMGSAVPATPGLSQAERIMQLHLEMLRGLKESGNQNISENDAWRLRQSLRQSLRNMSVTEGSVELAAKWKTLIQTEISPKSRLAGLIRVEIGDWLKVSSKAARPHLDSNLLRGISKTLRTTPAHIAAMVTASLRSYTPNQLAMIFTALILPVLATWMSGADTLPASEYYIENLLLYGLSIGLMPNGKPWSENEIREWLKTYDEFCYNFANWYKKEDDYPGLWEKLASAPPHFRLYLAREAAKYNPEILQKILLSRFGINPATEDRDEMEKIVLAGAEFDLERTLRNFTNWGFDAHRDRGRLIRMIEQFRTFDDQQPHDVVTGLDKLGLDPKDPAEKKILLKFYFEFAKSMPKNNIFHRRLAFDWNKSEDRKQMLGLVLTSLAYTPPAERIHMLERIIHIEMPMARKGGVQWGSFPREYYDTYLGPVKTVLHEFLEEYSFALTDLRARHHFDDWIEKYFTEEPLTAAEDKQAQYFFLELAALLEREGIDADTKLSTEQIRNYVDNLSIVENLNNRFSRGRGELDESIIAYVGLLKEIDAPLLTIWKKYSSMSKEEFAFLYWAVDGDISQLDRIYNQAYREVNRFVRSSREQVLQFMIMLRRNNVSPVARKSIMDHFSHADIAEYRELLGAFMLMIMAGVNDRFYIHSKNVSHDRLIKIAQAQVKKIYRFRGNATEFGERFSRSLGRWRNLNPLIIYIHKIGRLRTIRRGVDMLVYWLLEGTYREKRYAWPHIKGILPADVVDKWKENRMVSVDQLMMGLMDPGNLTVFKDMTIEDTDDSETLFTNPVGMYDDVKQSCKAYYQKIKWSRTLIGDSLDGKIKVMVIRDSRGNIAAKVLLKLLPQEEDHRNIFLLLNRVYCRKDLPRDVVRKISFIYALNLARGLQVDLAVIRGTEERYPDYDQTIRGFGYDLSQEKHAGTALESLGGAYIKETAEFLPEFEDCLGDRALENTPTYIIPENAVWKIAKQDILPQHYRELEVLQELELEERLPAAAANGRVVPIPRYNTWVAMDQAIREQLGLQYQNSFSPEADLEQSAIEIRNIKQPFQTIVLHKSHQHARSYFLAPISQSVSGSQDIDLMVWEENGRLRLQMSAVPNRLDSQGIGGSVINFIRATALRKKLNVEALQISNPRMRSLWLRYFKNIKDRHGVIYDQLPWSNWKNKTLLMEPKTLEETLDGIMAEMERVDRLALDRLLLPALHANPAIEHMLYPLEKKLDELIWERTRDPRKVALARLLVPVYFEYRHQPPERITEQLNRLKQLDVLYPEEINVLWETLNFIENPAIRQNNVFAQILWELLSVNSIITPSFGLSAANRAQAVKSDTQGRITGLHPLGLLRSVWQEGSFLFPQIVTYMISLVVLSVAGLMFGPALFQRILPLAVAASAGVAMVYDRFMAAVSSGRQFLGAHGEQVLVYQDGRYQLVRLTEKYKNDLLRLHAVKTLALIIGLVLGGLMPTWLDFGGLGVNLTFGIATAMAMGLGLAFGVHLFWDTALVRWLGKAMGSASVQEMETGGGRNDGAVNSGKKPVGDERVWTPEEERVWLEGEWAQAVNGQGPIEDSARWPGLEAAGYSTRLALMFECMRQNPILAFRTFPKFDLLIPGPNQTSELPFFESLSEFVHNLANLFQLISGRSQFIPYYAEEAGSKKDEVNKFAADFQMIIKLSAKMNFVIRELLSRHGNKGESGKLSYLISLEEAETSETPWPNQRWSTKDLIEEVSTDRKSAYSLPPNSLAARLNSSGDDQYFNALLAQSILKFSASLQTADRLAEQLNTLMESLENHGALFDNLKELKSGLQMLLDIRPLFDERRLAGQEVETGREPNADLKELYDSLSASTLMKRIGKMSVDFRWNETSSPAGNRTPVRVNRSMVIVDILLNLLINAKKHGEASQVEVIFSPDSITVKDNGSGIPFERMNNNGQDVRRRGNTFDPQGRPAGSGIGLASVCQTAHQYKAQTYIISSTDGNEAWIAGEDQAAQKETFNDLELTPFRGTIIHIDFELKDTEAVKKKIAGLIQGARPDREKNAPAGTGRNSVIGLAALAMSLVVFGPSVLHAADSAGPLISSDWTGWVLGTIIFLMLWTARYLVRDAVMLVWRMFDRWLQSLGPPPVTRLWMPVDLSLQEMLFKLSVALWKPIRENIGWLSEKIGFKNTSDGLPATLPASAPELLLLPEQTRTYVLMRQRAEKLLNRADQLPSWIPESDGLVRLVKEQLKEIDSSEEVLNFRTRVEARLGLLERWIEQADQTRNRILGAAPLLPPNEPAIGNFVRDLKRRAEELPAWVFEKDKYNVADRDTDKLDAEKRKNDLVARSDVFVRMLNASPDIFSRNREAVFMLRRLDKELFWNWKVVEWEQRFQEARGGRAKALMEEQGWSDPKQEDRAVAETAMELFSVESKLLGEDEYPIPNRGAWINDSAFYQAEARMREGGQNEEGHRELARNLIRRIRERKEVLERNARLQMAKTLHENLTHYFRNQLAGLGGHIMIMLRNERFKNEYNNQKKYSTKQAEGTPAENFIAYLKYLEGYFSQMTSATFVPSEENLTGLLALHADALMDTEHRVKGLILVLENIIRKLTPLMNDSMLLLQVARNNPDFEKNKASLWGFEKGYQILSEVIDSAKLITSMQMIPSTQPINLRKGLYAAVSHLPVEIRKITRVEIRGDAEETPVRMNWFLFTQLIHNLISNAITAEFWAPEIHILLEEQDEKISLTLTANGFPAMTADEFNAAKTYPFMAGSKKGYESKTAFFAADYLARQAGGSFENLPAPTPDGSEAFRVRLNLPVALNGHGQRAKTLDPERWQQMLPDLVALAEARGIESIYPLIQRTLEAQLGINRLNIYRVRRIRRDHKWTWIYASVFRSGMQKTLSRALGFIPFDRQDEKAELLKSLEQEKGPGEHIQIIESRAKDPRVNPYHLMKDISRYTLFQRGTVWPWLFRQLDWPVLDRIVKRLLPMRTVQWIVEHLPQRILSGVDHSIVIGLAPETNLSTESDMESEDNPATQISDSAAPKRLPTELLYLLLDHSITDEEKRVLAVIARQVSEAVQRERRLQRLTRNWPRLESRRSPDSELSSLVNMGLYAMGEALRLNVGLPIYGAESQLVPEIREEHSKIMGLAGRFIKQVHVRDTNLAVSSTPVLFNADNPNAFFEEFTQNLEQAGTVVDVQAVREAAISHLEKLDKLRKNTRESDDFTAGIESLSKAKVMNIQLIALLDTVQPLEEILSELPPKTPWGLESLVDFYKRVKELQGVNPALYTVFDYSSKLLAAKQPSQLWDTMANGLMNYTPFTGINTYETRQRPGSEVEYLSLSRRGIKGESRVAGRWNKILPGTEKDKLVNWGKNQNQSAPETLNDRAGNQIYEWKNEGSGVSYLHISQRHLADFVDKRELLRDCIRYVGARLPTWARSAGEWLALNMHPMLARMLIRLMTLFTVPKALKRVNEILHFDLKDQQGRHVGLVLANNWERGQPLFTSEDQKKRVLKVISMLFSQTRVSMESMKRKEFARKNLDELKLIMAELRGPFRQLLEVRYQNVIKALPSETDGDVEEIRNRMESDIKGLDGVLNILTESEDRIEKSYKDMSAELDKFVAQLRTESREQESRPSDFSGDAEDFLVAFYKELVGSADLEEIGIKTHAALRKVGDHRTLKDLILLLVRSAGEQVLVVKTLQGEEKEFRIGYDNLYQSINNIFVKIKADADKLSEAGIKEPPLEAAYQALLDLNSTAGICTSCLNTLVERHNGFSLGYTTDLSLENAYQGLYQALHAENSAAIIQNMLEDSTLQRAIPELGFLNMIRGGSAWGETFTMKDFTQGILRSLQQLKNGHDQGPEARRWTPENKAALTLGQVAWLRWLYREVRSNGHESLLWLLAVILMSGKAFDLVPDKRRELANLLAQNILTRYNDRNGSERIDIALAEKVFKTYSLIGDWLIGDITEEALAEGFEGYQAEGLKLVTLLALVTMRNVGKEGKLSREVVETIRENLPQWEDAFAWRGKLRESSQANHTDQKRLALWSYAAASPGTYTPREGLVRHEWIRNWIENLSEREEFPLWLGTMQFHSGYHNLSRLTPQNLAKLLYLLFTITKNRPGKDTGETPIKTIAFRSDLHWDRLNDVFENNTLQLENRSTFDIPSDLLATLRDPKKSLKFAGLTFMKNADQLIVETHEADLEKLKEQKKAREEKQAKEQAKRQGERPPTDAAPDSRGDAGNRGRKPTSVFAFPLLILSPAAPALGLSPEMAAWVLGGFFILTAGLLASFLFGEHGLVRRNGLWETYERLVLERRVRQISREQLPEARSSEIRFASAQGETATRDLVQSPRSVNFFRIILIIGAALVLTAIWQTGTAEAGIISGALTGQGPEWLSSLAWAPLAALGGLALLGIQSPWNRKQVVRESNIRWREAARSPTAWIAIPVIGVAVFDILVAFGLNGLWIGVAGMAAAWWMVQAVRHAYRAGRWLAEMNRLRRQAGVSLFNPVSFQAGWHSWRLRQNVVGITLEWRRQLRDWKNRSLGLERIPTTLDVQVIRFGGALSEWFGKTFETVTLTRILHETEVALPETQAVLEAFNQIAPNHFTVGDIHEWLVNQKRGRLSGNSPVTAELNHLLIQKGYYLKAVGDQGEDFSYVHLLKVTKSPELITRLEGIPLRAVYLMHLRTLQGPDPDLETRQLAEHLEDLNLLAIHVDALEAKAKLIAQTGAREERTGSDILQNYIFTGRKPDEIREQLTAYVWDRVAQEMVDHLLGIDEAAAALDQTGRSVTSLADYGLVLGQKESFLLGLSDLMEDAKDAEVAAFFHELLGPEEIPERPGSKIQLVKSRSLEDRLKTLALGIKEGSVSIDELQSRALEILEQRYAHLYRLRGYANLGMGAGREILAYRAKNTSVSSKPAVQGSWREPRAKSSKQLFSFAPLFFLPAGLSPETVAWVAGGSLLVTAGLIAVMLFGANGSARPNGLRRVFERRRLERRVRQIFRGHFTQSGQRLTGDQVRILADGVENGSLTLTQIGNKFKFDSAARVGFAEYADRELQDFTFRGSPFPLMYTHETRGNSTDPIIREALDRQGASAPDRTFIEVGIGWNPEMTLETQKQVMHDRAGKIIGIDSARPYAVVRDLSFTPWVSVVLDAAGNVLFVLLGEGVSAQEFLDQWTVEKAEALRGAVRQAGQSDKPENLEIAFIDWNGTKPGKNRVEFLHSDIRALPALKDIRGTIVRALNIAHHYPRAVWERIVRENIAPMLSKSGYLLRGHTDGDGKGYAVLEVRQKTEDGTLVRRSLPELIEQGLVKAGPQNVVLPEPIFNRLLDWQGPVLKVLREINERLAGRGQSGLVSVRIIGPWGAGNLSQIDVRTPLTLAISARNLPESPVLRSWAERYGIEIVALDRNNRTQGIEIEDVPGFLLEGKSVLAELFLQIANHVRRERGLNGRIDLWVGSTAEAPGTDPAETAAAPSLAERGRQDDVFQILSSNPHLELTKQNEVALAGWQGGDFELNPRLFSLADNHAREGLLALGAARMRSDRGFLAGWEILRLPSLIRELGLTAPELAEMSRFLRAQLRDLKPMDQPKGLLPGLRWAFAQWRQRAADYLLAAALSFLAVMQTMRTQTGSASMQAVLVSAGIAGLALALPAILPQHVWVLAAPMASVGMAAGLILFAAAWRTPARLESAPVAEWYRADVSRMTEELLEGLRARIRAGAAQMSMAGDSGLSRQMLGTAIETAAAQWASDPENLKRLMSVLPGTGSDKAAEFLETMAEAMAEIHRPDLMGRRLPVAGLGAAAGAAEMSLDLPAWMKQAKAAAPALIEKMAGEALEEESLPVARTRETISLRDRFMLLLAGAIFLSRKVREIRQGFGAQKAGKGLLDIFRHPQFRQAVRQAWTLANHPDLAPDLPTRLARKERDGLVEAVNTNGIFSWLFGNSSRPQARLTELFALRSNAEELWIVGLELAPDAYFAQQLKLRNVPEDEAQTLLRAIEENPAWGKYLAQLKDLRASQRRGEVAPARARLQSRRLERRLMSVILAELSAPQLPAEYAKAVLAALSVFSPGDQVQVFVSLPENRAMVLNEVRLPAILLEYPWLRNRLLHYFAVFDEQRQPLKTRELKAFFESMA